MNEKITINGTEYKVPEFNYGAIVRLEKLGVNFNDIESQSFTFICGLVAYTIGCTAEKASEEIDKHLSSDGSFEDFSVLIEAVTKSDFFQRLLKKRKK